LGGKKGMELSRSEMDSRTEQLRARTKDFAIRIIHLFQALPSTKEAQTIGNQLLRCGTAVGANYRSACHARSRADFISKIGVVTEEADESVFWIELLSDLKIMKTEGLADLLQEARELTAIFSASRQTAKQRR
jgi:four helix bundle protein